MCASFEPNRLWAFGSNHTATLSIRIRVERVGYFSITLEKNFQTCSFKIISTFWYFLRNHQAQIYYRPLSGSMFVRRKCHSSNHRKGHRWQNVSRTNARSWRGKRLYQTPAHDPDFWKFRQHWTHRLSERRIDPRQCPALNCVCHRRLCLLHSLEVYQYLYQVISNLSWMKYYSQVDSRTTITLL